jgi:6-phosphogluconolactonase
MIDTVCVSVTAATLLVELPHCQFPVSDLQFPHAMRIFILTIALLVALAAPAREHTVYVGTYTGPNASKGIYKFGFDTKTGEVTSPLELAAEIVSPSFLAIHPNGRFLYAVNEAGKGAVTAYAIDPKTKTLTKINDQPSIGSGPCHINVDSKGKHVVIANYGGGSIAALPINKDGSLKPASSFVQHKGSSINQSRQKEPHGHSVNFDKSGKYVFAADLGLDKVIIYKFDSNEGTLTEAGFGALKPGSGPRHLAVAKDNKRVYVINEITSTVTGFNYDGKTNLTAFQTISTLPQETPGNSTAEIVIHPSGKFVYGSNRGHNSIAVFAVDKKSGELERVQNAPIEGKIPRNFVVDPTGKFLLAAGQDSNTIAIFSIDQSTGKLTYTGKSLQAFKPVCLRFHPSK